VPAIRVLKLGGSLLGWSGLREALRRWREAKPAACDLLVVGGGAAADWVREADRVHQLGDDVAHWLAIDAMQLNAALAAAIWPEARWCESLHQRKNTEHGLQLLRPWPALSDAEQGRFGTPLPHSWDVTSDSIAAWVARAIGARELVLLKSSLPRGDSMQMAIDAGYVDRHFATAARGIEAITAVNLRSESLASRRFAPDADASGSRG